MSEEDVACNYTSLQDHGKRIKDLEQAVKFLADQVDRIEQERVSK